jgi:hypothetical protein
MIGHYPPEEFVVYVDSTEAEEAPRIVTAAEISAIDARIKAAVTGGTFADGFARNDEIDDGSRRRRDVRADGEDSGQLVDKVLRHFDEALRMHADALTKRMDAIEAKFKKRKDGHFDEEREEGEEGEDKDREVRLDKRRKDDLHVHG